MTDKELREKIKAGALALAIKRVSTEGTGFGGFPWPESGPVAAPDWTPEPVCYGGLFGCLWGVGVSVYLPDEDDPCRVIAVDPESCVDVDGNKVKFPSGVVVFSGLVRDGLAFLKRFQRHRVRTPKPDPGPSEAWRHLEHCWDLICERYPSHRIVGWAMRDALKFACRYLRFNRGDIAAAHAKFRGVYWFGDDGGEWAYRIADEHKNDSACRSFEAFKGRKPFLLPDGCRLRVGTQFWWPWKAPNSVGKHYTVSSFAADGLSLTACTYEYVKDDRGYSNKQLRGRIRVTLAELDELRKPRRKAAS